MEDAPRELPRPIRIAIGFLLVDILWCGLALAYLLFSGRNGGGAEALILAGLALLIPLISGLLKREPWAIPFGIAVLGSCAGIVAVPLALQIEDRFPTRDDLLLAAVLVWFLVPLALLVASPRVLTK